MATINSNNLGVYAYDSAMTTPLEVLDTATAIGSLTNADAPSGAAEGDKFMVVNGTQFVGIAEVSSATAGDAVTDRTNSLGLVALATSSSLESSVAVNETAARNGSGGSTNFIASGAMSWSTSVDGLLDVAGATGSAITVMDAARAKNYMIVKFDIDEGAGNTFYAGQVLIDSVSISGGVDDIATYSASFTGYGDLYKG
jgi:hypothetical protein